METSAAVITKDIFRYSFCVPPQLTRVKNGKLEFITLKSFEELRKKCPEDDKHGEVRLQEQLKSKDGGAGLDIYSRSSKLFPGAYDNVAYGCPICKNIYACHPIIEIDEDVLNYFCNCSMLLLRQTPELPEEES